MSKVGSGWFFDRFSIRGIQLFWLLLAISIFLGLPVAGVGTLLAFIVVRGVAHGGMIIDVPVLTKHYFGMERIGMTLGLTEVCVNLGFAAGPPVFGWFADTYGNFSAGMVVYGVLALIGTALLLPVKPRYWVSAAEREASTAAAERPATAAG